MKRVAEKYLNPENLTICVFGMLTDDDKAELNERYEVKILAKEEVFTGGYDEPGNSESSGGRAADQTPLREAS